MTDSEKLAMLKAMTGEKKKPVLSTYLSIAGNKVCRRAYPFDPTQTTVPPQYEIIQIEIAAYLLNRRGSEGETVHLENGISRHYEDGDVPPSLMRDIIPFSAVLSSTEDEEAAEDDKGENEDGESGGEPAEGEEDEEGEDGEDDDT